MMVTARHLLLLLALSGATLRPAWAEELAESRGHVVVLLPAEAGLDPERLAEHLASRVDDLAYAVTVAPAPEDDGLGGQVDTAREAGLHFQADAVVWLHRLAGTRLLVFLSEGREERIIARDLDTAGASEDDALEALAIIVRSVLRAHVTLTRPVPPEPPEPPEEPAQPSAGDEEPVEQQGDEDQPEGGDEEPEEPRRTPVAWPRGGLAVLLQGVEGDTSATLVGGYIGVDLRITDLIRVGIAAWILPPAEARSDADLTVTMSRVPIDITAAMLWQVGPLWVGPRAGVVLDPVTVRSSTQVRADSFEVGIAAELFARFGLLDRIWIEAEAGVNLFFTEHTYADPAAESPDVLVFPFLQPRFAVGIAVDVP